jgi:hypothetical protein
MPAELYNSLFDNDAAHEGNQSLVAAFAQLGRISRAASELANDEMMEGLWVFEEDEVQQAARYAADDRRETSATFSADGYSVRVAFNDGVWTATQQNGRSGASLKVHGEWVVLTPGTPAELSIEGLPESLTLVDLTGQEIQLQR